MMDNAKPIELPAAYELQVIDETIDLRQEVIQQASNGANEGTIIWAKKQHQAKGRLKQPWHCQDQDLHSAIILKPDFATEQYGEMTIVAAMALGNAIAASLSPMTALAFHWPNKLMIANHRIAGIWLDEGKDIHGEPFLGITVSVNIQQSPQDFSIAAMSIAEAEGGIELTAKTLFTEFAREFITQINLWSDRGFDHLWQMWLRRAEGKQQPVQLILQEALEVVTLGEFDDHGGIRYITNVGTEAATSLNEQMQVDVI